MGGAVVLTKRIGELLATSTVDVAVIVGLTDVRVGILVAAVVDPAGFRER